MPYVKNIELQGKTSVLERDIEETRESINRRLLPSGDIGRTIRKVKELSKESSELKSELESIKKSVELIKEQIDAVLSRATPEKTEAPKEEAEPTKPTKPTKNNK